MGHELAGSLASLSTPHPRPVSPPLLFRCVRRGRAAAGGLRPCPRAARRALPVKRTCSANEGGGKCVGAGCINAETAHVAHSVARRPYGLPLANLPPLLHPGFRPAPPARPAPCRRSPTAPSTTPSLRRRRWMGGAAWPSPPCRPRPPSPGPSASPSRSSLRCPSCAIGGAAQTPGPSSTSGCVQCAAGWPWRPAKAHTDCSGAAGRRCRRSAAAAATAPPPRRQRHVAVLLSGAAAQHSNRLPPRLPPHPLAAPSPCARWSASSWPCTWPAWLRPGPSPGALPPWAPSCSAPSAASASTSPSTGAPCVYCSISLAASTCGRRPPPARLLAATSSADPCSARPARPSPSPCRRPAGS